MDGSNGFCPYNEVLNACHICSNTVSLHLFFNMTIYDKSLSPEKQNVPISSAQNLPPHSDVHSAIKQLLETLFPPT
jgi:hypothetical protein